jgi:hypothetical protein
MNPVHNFPPYFPKIHSSIISYLRLYLPSGLFPSGFPTKILYAFLISSMRATFPVSLKLLDLITLVMFYTEINEILNKTCYTMYILESFFSFRNKLFQAISAC